MDDTHTMEHETAAQYTGTAKVLHWLMALLIIGLFALGQSMSDLSMSPLKLQLYSWHKWVGAAFFIVHHGAGGFIKARLLRGKAEVGI